MTSIANTPEPRYFAVIFTSQRTVSDNGYGDVADRMAELAAQQNGYLGAESVRDAEGFGITVSYWSTSDSIKRWKANVEHLAAQQKGKSNWYQLF